MVKRPMKAPSKSITNEELSLLKYPVYGSPKLDGFRCITHNAAYTSSLKLVNNAFIQSILSKPEYSGLDGELIVGEANDPEVFNKTTGPVRRKEGAPDFTLWVFDSITMKDEPYYRRLANVLDRTLGLPYLQVLKQFQLNNPQEVINFEQWCIEQGFEGAMIRSMNGLYKEGRCTLKELNIFKRKPLEDDEAIIVGFDEQKENNNEAYTNELGLTTRNSNAENKTGKNTLGAFLLQSKKWKEPFNCGTGIGLTENLRKEIWFNQSNYKGRIVTYKYQAHGSIDAPRQPIFKGFRDSGDITEY